MGISKRNPRGNFNWQKRYLGKKAECCGQDSGGPTPVPPPVADFSASPLSLTEGGTVNFTDLSTNSPTSWAWTFPGGTPATSSLQNPSVVYSAVGVHSVSLDATNAGGTGSVSKPNYIDVLPNPPVADFSGSPTTVYVGNNVAFTDLSTNTPTSWSWSFAGGTPATSTTQNPSVVYNTVGTYGVDLTASNIAGSDLESKPNYITVDYPYLLNVYPNATGAYSTRRLNGSYAGAALRLRNGAGIETDIGFVGENIDEAAMLAHTGAGDGYVTVWYDQSGNGRNLVQTSGGAQPKVISTGVINKVNGKVSLPFVGGYYMQGLAGDESAFDFTNTFSTYITARPSTQTNNAQIILNKGSNNYGVNGWYIDMMPNANYLIINSPAGNAYGAASGAFALGLASYNLGGGNGVAAFQGVVKATYTGTVANSLPNNNVLLVGTYLVGDATNDFDGDISEIVIYPTDQSANRVGIETNINNYFQLYYTGTGVLDTYSGAAAAYSVRMLSSTYRAKPIIRVRRSSDSAERDFYIGYNGLINTVEILSFVGAGNGFVTKWYDQTGSNRDAIQTSAFNQPRIVNAGVLFTQNSLVSINCYDSNRCAFNITEGGFGNPTILTNKSYGYAFVAARTAQTTATRRTLFSIASTNINSSRFYIGAIASLNAMAMGGKRLDTDTLESTSTTTHDSAFNLLTGVARYADAEAYLYKNGVLAGSKVPFQTAGATSNTVSYNYESYIGSGRGDVSGGIENGSVSEVIMYNTDQASNRAAIETNIKNYFSIV